MMDYDLIDLSLNELWAIHDHVRQHQEYGAEWDRDFMARVMECIIAANGNTNRHATLMMSSEELWQCDRQIPSALMVGTEPTGKNLLMKVMRLVLKLRGDDDEHDDANHYADQNTGSAAAAEAGS